MKISAFIPLVVFAVISCSQNKNTPVSEDKESNIQAIGGNKDEHGCLSSAGYRWSELKNDCIQIFNVGQRLNPIHVDKDEAIISSFIIMSSDHSKAELHIEDKQLILAKTGEYTFEKDNYKYDYKKCMLYIDGKEAYELEESK